MFAGARSAMSAVADEVDHVEALGELEERDVVVQISRSPSAHAVVDRRRAGDEPERDSSPPTSRASRGLRGVTVNREGAARNRLLDRPHVAPARARRRRPRSRPPCGRPRGQRPHELDPYVLERSSEAAWISSTCSSSRIVDGPSAFLSPCASKPAGVRRALRRASRSPRLRRARAGVSGHSRNIQLELYVGWRAHSASRAVHASGLQPRPDGGEAGVPRNR